MSKVDEFKQFIREHLEPNKTEVYFVTQEEYDEYNKLLGGGKLQPNITQLRYMGLEVLIKKWPIYTTTK